jgi:hypothetical protein
MPILETVKKWAGHLGTAASLAALAGNPHEVIRDSEGNRWFVDVTHSGRDYLAQAFEGKGHKVGRHLSARGATESEAYDRLIHQIEPNPARRPRMRRNPSELAEAQRLYETFHGRTAANVTDYDEPDDAREDLAALGWLTETVFYPRTRNHGDAIDAREVAKVRRPSEKVTRPWDQVARELGICLAVLSFEDDKVAVASNAEGTQLYLIGGRQDLSGVLDKFDADESKDFIELGDALAISYLASKAQSDYKPMEWEHILGEESGYSPFGYWNRLQSRIYLVGGDYRVDEPGIIN